MESFDYIVVGAGSSGCVVAARLAESGLGSVLLLEAGDLAEQNPETLSADGFIQAFANDNTMLDRLSTAQPRCAGRHLYMGSGTGMGGSGAVNGMVYTRGDKRDYAQWPQGWHWDDVNGYFDQLEQALRVRTRPGNEFTETCLSAAIQAGFKRKDKLNDGDLNGYLGYQLMNYEGAYRRSSYAAFLHGRHYPNLTIATKARSQRIVFDDDRKAIELEYLQHGIRHRVGIKREIVLCSGALETPKLLMLSGVGPQQTLNHFKIKAVLIAPAIGRHLQDHPNVCVFYRGRKPPQSFYPQLYGFERINPQSVLAQEQPDTCFVFYAASASIQHSMERMMPAIVLNPKLYQRGAIKRWVRSLVRGLFRIPLTRLFVSKLYGIVVILGKPQSRGEVNLASGDAEVPAQVNPGYFLRSEDLECMVDGVLRAQQIAGQPSLQGWGNVALSKAARTGDREQIKKWIKGAAMTTFHYAGSCRMGVSDNDPVDRQLRVKGLQNVRVADASVIPEIPVSALNAPSMMIGWRAADLILENRMQLQDTNKQKTKKPVISQSPASARGRKKATSS